MECQASKTFVTIVFLIGLADFLADIRGRLRVKKGQLNVDGKNRPFRICAYACTSKSRHPPAEDGCGS
jgi:hypothetical protein